MPQIEKKSIQTGLEIAVVGMAGRFPGASSIDEFWENLYKGVESISFFTDEELTEMGISLRVLEKSNYVKAKGILENIDVFDASFFNYLPEEAEIMDPQVRIFHECAWEALENANCDPESYPGLIGLYSGITSNPYWAVGNLATARTGSGRLMSGYLNSNYFSTLISYKLNLKGPAITVQTACSTSLVAIHQACRALLTGECHIALAGGVTIGFPQKSGYLYETGVITSMDGHCRPFDSRATGTISGNGVGIVVLKRLPAAIEDKDDIYAIIKGTAINNDGNRKVGYTAPSVEGQCGVLQTAMQMAEVEPESIGYIEAHGTATPLGDPIEFQALKLAFNTNNKGFCAIGSVKSNVGHLDSAAGAAGFIKVVLMLKNRLIPPSLHFEVPNHGIDLENSPFYVVTAPTQWLQGKYPLRAGVSSFGIGGTNAHVLLEEWAIPLPSKEKKSTEGHPYQLIMLSAKTPTALDRMTQNLGRYLRENPDINLADAAYTLQVGRSSLKCRKMMVRTTREETTQALLTNISQGVHTFSLKKQNPPLIFLFPGQGAQYINMGRDLYQNEPVFREEMDRCFNILKSLWEHDLKDILYPGLSVSVEESIRREESLFQSLEENFSLRSPQPAATSDRINQTEITQPLLFTFEYALAKLLMQWGMKPYAMMGHSIGEYTAACLAEVFSLEDALKLVVQRGILMQQVPRGGMLSLPLPATEVEPFLHEQLSLAAINSTSLCVVSGSDQAIEALQAEMKKKGHQTRRLHTSHAFHSQMMNPILEKFAAQVKSIPLHPPKLPYISNVTGEWITVQQAVDPEYWAKHLRVAIQFSRGIESLLIQEPSVLVEVGPGKTLGTFVRQHSDRKQSHRLITLVRHPQEQFNDQEYLLNALGHLWLYGKKIAWKEFYSRQERKRISLPTYPFEGQSFKRQLNFMKEMYKMLAQGSDFISIPRNSMTADPCEEQARTGGDESTQMRPELSTPYAPPENAIEQELVEIWQEFFGIRQLGIYDDFFELGGDSLKVMLITSIIHQKFNVKISFKDFFALPNTRGIAAYIRKGEEETYARIEPVEKKEFYPLSPAQRRLYVMQEIDIESTGYNMSQAWVVEGKLDRERLENTLKRMIERHESYRTSFAVVGEDIVQRILPGVESAVEIYHVDGFEKSTDIEKIIRSFIRTFNLSFPPLIRLGLIQVEEIKYILIVDFHHIVADGVSIGIFIKDFISLYLQKEMSPLRLQYKDFSYRQNLTERKEALKKQELYWLKKFTGEIPVLDLPFDYHESGNNLEGDYIQLILPEQTAIELKELSRKTESTLYMALLAIFNILLSHYSGQEDIIVGSPITGRRHNELHDIIGMFVNMLALRNRVDKKKIFSQFLAEVKKDVLEAYENQDYQFDELVIKLLKDRSNTENPIFNTVLAMQNFEFGEGVETPPSKDDHLDVKPYKLANEISRFDLTLFVFETTQGIRMRYRYSTAKFSKSTIEKFSKHFIEILDQVAQNMDVKIDDIRLSSDLLLARQTAMTNDVDFNF